MDINQYFQWAYERNQIVYDDTKESEKVGGPVLTVDGYLVLLPEYPLPSDILYDSILEELPGANLAIADSPVLLPAHWGFTKYRTYENLTKMYLNMGCVLPANTTRILIAVDEKNQKAIFGAY